MQNPATNSYNRCDADKKSERGNIQLDSSSSSDDSDNENIDDVQNRHHPQQSQHQSSMHHPVHPPMASSMSDPLSADDGTDQQQSTMWLGTEDGCIHVYNCTDNIRIKKNKIKIQQISAVYSIL